MRAQVPDVIERERYEFSAPPAYRFATGRRDFFKFLGAGVAVFLVARDAAAFQESGRGGGRGFRGQNLPKDIGAWLHIGEGGTVTVYTGKVEMGQNIRTSLAQAVAEELRAGLGSINLVMGNTNLVPYDMGTFGSRTTPTMNLELRRVASVARDTLIELAARSWNADPSRLVAADGRIRDPQSGQVIEYGRLAQGQTLAKAVVENDPLTPAAEWHVAGQPIPKVNGREFVTGKHQYTPDVRLPGMQYGKALRPPSFGAQLVSVDLSGAKALPGVTPVRDGDFVGVAAPRLKPPRELSTPSRRIGARRPALQPGNL